MSGRLAFLDETWTKINLTHVRAGSSEALLATVPHGHWKTLTFIGALRREDIVEDLEKAPSAFIDLLRGGNVGKRLVRVSADAA